MGRNKRYRPIDGSSKATSKASAAALQATRKTAEADKQQILAFLKAEGNRGFTGREIELTLNMRSASSRIYDMVQAGWLIRTDQKRRNPGKDGTPETGSWATLLITPDEDAPRIPLPKKKKASEVKTLKRLLRKITRAVDKHEHFQGSIVKALRLHAAVLDACQEANGYLGLLRKYEQDE